MRREVTLVVFLASSSLHCFVLLLCLIMHLVRHSCISLVLLPSGVLFAATHLEPSQFWGLSLLGFGTGGVAMLSGSTLPAILCHLTYNSSAVALVLLAKGG